MKLLHKYIVTEFLKILVITIAAFVVIFMLAEFFEKIDELISKDVPIFESFAYFLLRIPYIVGMVSPIAVLLAVVLSLGILTRRSEITAIKAGGISIIKVVTPLLICGVIISAAVLVVNEVVVPITNRRVYSIEMKWLDKKPRGMFRREGMWIRSREGIYNIMKVDLKNNTLYDITLSELADNFEVTGRLKAKSARWINGHWVAKDATMIKFTSTRLESPEDIGQWVLTLDMGPNDFSRLENRHENMGFFELRRYAQKLEKDGYNTTKYIVDLYAKLSFPLVNFLMILVGVPFALREGRRGSIADGVAISMAIGFSFWVIFAISRSLGQSGVIPPIVAASFTDILFLAVGVYLFGYVRQ